MGSQWGRWCVHTCCAGRSGCLRSAVSDSVGGARGSVERGRRPWRETAGAAAARSERVARLRLGAARARGRESRLGGRRGSQVKREETSAESAFLSLKIVVDRDAFVELSDYPETARLEFVVKLTLETCLRRLSDESDESSHFYELENATGPDARGRRTCLGSYLRRDRH